MVDKQRLENCILYQEMSEADQKYWFDMKTKKFLHNIDTFYYSVKLREDFTLDSQDKNVLAFRRVIERLQNQATRKGYDGEVQQFFVAGNGINDYLNIISKTFAHRYSFCLELPDMFDIFIAPIVPGNETCISVTCEIIVQLRSEMLWQYGVNAAFEKSFAWVQAICNMYNFTIAEVKENRTDFCWHSNYIEKTDKFFTLDNYFKMRVTTLDRKGLNLHAAPVGSDGHEVDYLAIGNRGDKCFLRIYLKSKEVIQEGYKSWFLKTWLFHGLINRYDFDIYEQAYLKRSWSYTTIARLKFYQEHGSSEYYRDECKRMIALYELAHKVTDGMIELADELTPALNLIVNVEFQLMRKASKTYDIIPFKDNTEKGACKRIYDFLDNRRLITDYLTSKTFRLVEKTGDSNKSRRPDCGFWAALRHTKMVDAAPVPEGLKMQRIYNRKLNAERLKQSVIHKAVTYGMYMKGINNDSPVSDVMLSVLRLNDNDIKEAKRYKERKAKLLNKEALADVMPAEKFDYDLALVDKYSGLFLEPEDIGGWLNDDAGGSPGIFDRQKDILRTKDNTKLYGASDEVSEEYSGENHRRTGNG
ncbi:MAG: hypothetical protein ACI4FZ_07580 [Lachnospiraceae bacterium]